MKKVRYAIAIGAAPALGLAMPTALAAAATAHVPANGSKKVAIPDHRRACAGISVKSNHVGTGASRLSETTFYQPRSCVTSVSGFLYHQQVSLYMRIRGYRSGFKVYSHFDKNGCACSGATKFFQRSINRYLSNLCIAYTSQGSRRKVLYGPVCTRIT